MFFFLPRNGCNCLFHRCQREIPCTCDNVGFLCWRGICVCVHCQQACGGWIVLAFGVLFMLCVVVICRTHLCCWPRAAVVNEHQHINLMHVWYAQVLATRAFSARVVRIQFGVSFVQVCLQFVQIETIHFDRVQCDTSFGAPLHLYFRCALVRQHRLQVFWPRRSAQVKLSSVWRRRAHSTTHFIVSGSHWR